MYRGPGTVLENFSVENCTGTAVRIRGPAAADAPSAPPPQFQTTIRSVEFFNNTDTSATAEFDQARAGALSILGSGSVVVQNCTFIGNGDQDSSAGAISSLGSSLSVANSAFLNNTARVSAGAVGADSSEPDADVVLNITNCRFTGNRVMQGLEQTGELTAPNGAPLEASQLVMFPFTAVSAAGVSAQNLLSVFVSGTTFDSNFAVPVGGAMTLLQIGNVALANNTFLNNEASEREGGDLAAAQGGAVYVASTADAANYSIVNNTFQNNTAGYGGALHVVSSASATVDINSNSFVGNTAWLGGGAVVLRNALNVNLQNVNATGNRAQTGGAILVVNGAGVGATGNTSPEGSSEYRGNVAIDGGAIYMQGSADVVLKAARFVGNHALRDGGAVAAQDSVGTGQTTLQDASFSGNTAHRGGALFIDSLSSFRMQATAGRKLEFENNAALAGGAVYVRMQNPVGNAFEFDILDASFRGNKAVTSPNDTQFGDLDVPNRGGGELDLFGAVNEVVGGRGGSLLIDPRSEEPCVPGGGGAICLALARAPRKGTLAVQIDSCAFENNSAATGGGILAATDSLPLWLAPGECRAASSASLPLGRCHEMVMSNLNFTSNMATAAGGALFATHAEDIWISEGFFSQPLQLTNVTADGASFASTGLTMIGNGVGQDGFGPNVASSVTLLNRTSELTENGFFEEDHKGSDLLPKITFDVCDAFNQRIRAGITDSELKVTASGSDATGKDFVSGQRTADAVGGLVLFDGIRVSSKPGSFNLTFEAAGLRAQLEPAVGRLSVRDCRPGEFNFTEQSFCAECNRGVFSLLPTVQCRKCDDRAHCPGGAALVPLPGFWHSSPFSLRLHKCILEEACSFEAEVSDTNKTVVPRDDILASFFNNLTVGEVINARDTGRQFSNEEYQQCREGYQGVLCGSCAPGFGHLPGGECTVCDKTRGEIVFIVFLVALWTFLLLAIAIRSALSSIRNLEEMTVWQQGIGCSQRRGQNPPATSSGCLRAPRSAPSNLHGSAQTPGSADAGWDAESPGKDGGPGGQSAQGRKSLRSRSMPVRSTSRREGGDKRELPPPQSPHRRGWSRAATKPLPSIDHIIAAEKTSETLKILINFLQVTGVAVAINLTWTGTAKNLLGLWDTLAGVSNGSSQVPLDCALQGGSDTSDNSGIRASVIRVCFPLILFATASGCFGLFFLLRLRHAYPDNPVGYIRSRVKICLLAVVFFSYQSLTEEFMRTLNCVELDNERSNVGIPEEYVGFATARDSYWAEDTAKVCYEGMHAVLAFVIGIPGLVVFSLGVPAFLLGFLLMNNHRGRLLDRDFLNTYGFVYQNYDEDHRYWEVVILLRKGLIGAIVVFGHEAGANLQGVMGLGIILLALVAQTVGRPYKHKTHNLLEGASLLVTILTFYSGIVFNDSNTSQGAEVLLTTIVLLANIGLVLSFMGAIAVYVDRYVTAKLKMEEVRAIPSNFPVRVLTLAKVVVDNLRRGSGSQEMAEEGLEAWQDEGNGRGKEVPSNGAHALGSELA
ncbi:unnamed protein product [Ostreobium quekettii]|uniref:TRP C-terminal domain-containing protein n=1 Tax=Ostreobium quekettii TaxID=121088 RepID=A0A8S1IPS1_9CHLO|nr:unnamed protein product [Ostreobium quekettii]